MPSSFEKRILIGFGFALAAVLLVGVATYASARRLIESHRAVAQSEESIGQLRLLLSTMADAEARLAEIPQFLLRAEAKTIETFLDELHERHGGAREWARASGVSAESLDAMSTLLVSADS